MVFQEIHIQGSLNYIAMASLVKARYMASTPRILTPGGEAGNSGTNPQKQALLLWNSHSIFTNEFEGRQSSARNMRGLRGWDLPAKRGGSH